MSLYDDDKKAGEAKYIVDSIFHKNTQDSLNGLMGDLPKQSTARAIYALGDSILTLATVVLREQIKNEQ